MIEWLAKLLIGDKFLRWLGRFAEDSHSNSPSTKRYGQLATITTFCLLAVYIAFLLGALGAAEALLWAFVAVCVCLMLLAGFGYILTKYIERMPYTPPDVKPPRAMSRTDKQEGGE